MREEELEKQLDAILNEGPVAMPAPAKPAPTKPSPTKPAPGRPAPSRPSPFKPPKPHTVPKPKAEDMADKIEEAVENADKPVNEAYDDEVNSNTKNFWENLPKDMQHTFAKHPLLAIHGDRLSRSAYEYLADGDPQSVQLWFQRIMRVERNFIPQLEELAKDLTVKIWGVPKEMLHAEITTDVEIPENEPAEAGSPPEMEAGEEPSDELRAQINKRITTNALTHGAAVHQMLSMHHVVDKELNEIDKRLIKAYSSLSKGSVKMYWFMDIAMIADSLRNMKVGNSAVVWQPPEKEDEEEKPEDEYDLEKDTELDESELDEAKIVAKAVCFPVLCQELSKGVMEMLMMHGYSELEPKVQDALQRYSDILEDEPWLIQIGPELWRRMLKVIPKDVPLSELVMELGMMDPGNLHKVMDATIDYPEDAKEMLGEIADKIRQPEERDVDVDDAGPENFEDEYGEYERENEGGTAEPDVKDEIGYDPEEVEFNPDDFDLDDDDK